jgi:ribosomal subunit interface protein
MSVEITVRHLDISETLQEFARDKANKLRQEFPPIEFVRIVLDKDGPFYTSETIVQGGRHMNAESKHRDGDMITAINAAVEKAQTQLRRQMQKLHEVRT